MNRLIIFGLVLLGGAASEARAQTEARVSVGVSTTINVSTDGDVGTGKGVGVLVRLNSTGPTPTCRIRRWGVGDFARLWIRPVMAGVSYSTVRGRLLTSYSIVAGPSFNRVKFSDQFVRSSAASIDADTSFAIRPGLGVTYTLRERVALVGFGGYRHGVRR